MAMAVLIVCVVGILVTEHKRRNAFISCSEWRMRMERKKLGNRQHHSRQWWNPADKG